MAVLNVRANTVAATTGFEWVATNLAVDGAHGTVPATFAYWTSSVVDAVGTIDLGFGTLLSAGIAAGSTVTSLALSVTHSSHATRIVGITMALFDGATAIGTPQSCVINATAHQDTFTFYPTLAQVRSATLVVRMTATHNNSVSAANYFVDHVDAVVTYVAAVTDVRVSGVQLDVAYSPTGVGLRVTGLQVDVAYVYSGPAPTGPTVTVWNGTAEMATTLFVWNGTAEIAASVEQVTA